MDFPQKLKELRKKKGYTQEKMSNLLEIGQSAYAKWENGRTQPNIEQLVKIPQTSFQEGIQILETIDIMREVVIQNSKLNAEVAELKIKNQNLSDRENDKYSQLNNAINRFKSQLAEYESYDESENIRVILRKIEVELSEYVD